MEETIVAPATPQGRGGISIIRLSGEGASSVGLGLCGILPGSWSLKPCSILDFSGEVLDYGLVVFFAGPKSYTGEDVVEIHCHGNPLIVDSIISSAISFGARMAEPGEFTKRAFLNNKIDLAQAESVADLIAAKTKSAVLGASSSLSGKFSNTVKDCIDRLVKLRVLIEATLDFPEEEGVGFSPQESKQVYAGLKKEFVFVDRLVSGSLVGLRLREGVKVVIVGPPNCGKSTLLNCFAENELAIVSKSPGTTRDTIKVGIDLGGIPVELVDTAGIRDDKAGLVEKEGMRRAFKELEGAGLVLVMSVVGEEFAVSVDEGVSVIRVFNKVDLFSKKNLVGPKGSVFISAKKRTGLASLEKKMCSFVGLSPGSEVPLFARRRHLSFLQVAKECLARAVDVAVCGGGEELVAEELREAQAALGEITNPISSDALLGEIFSSFCVGK